MSQNLFVRNLSWSVTEADLVELFSQAGGVKSAKIPLRREDGKPRGFAFVEMASAEAAQQAISQCNGVPLYNREIVVSFQDEEKGDRRPVSPGYSQSNSSNGSSGKNAKLFVRNLSYQVTETDLQDLFQQAGTVLSVKIPTDRETGTQKGFAFIEMASAEEAEYAMKQFNNHLVSGREIAIDYQDSNRNKSRPSGGVGYSGGGRSGGGGGYSGGGKSGGYDRSDRW